jgi:hypothetical protein
MPLSVPETFLRRTGRNCHSILTDVFGRYLIADLVPNSNRMIGVWKKDGQLRQPEFFGLRGAGNAGSVNFAPMQLRPILVA